MCLGQSSHFFHCHISSTNPGRSSFFQDVLVLCDLCSKLAPLSPSPKAREPRGGRFSWRLCWELWWKPFLCFWLPPWVTLPGLQSGLEPLWGWMSELSSSQDRAGLHAAGAAPTPACWQRQTYFGAVLHTAEPSVCFQGRDAVSTSQPVVDALLSRKAPPARCSPPYLDWSLAAFHLFLLGDCWIPVTHQAVILNTVVLVPK